MSRKLRKDKDALFTGRLAKEYDLFPRAVPHHDEFQRTIGRFVNEVIVKPAKREGLGAIIAECGPGTGLTLSMVSAETNGFEGIDRVYAVDKSPAMIRLCSRRFSNPKIEFVTLDFIRFLDTLDARLDGVYSAYVLHNLAHKSQVAIFKAIHDRLRQGGHFVNGDMFAYSNPAMEKMQFEWRLERFRRELPPKLAAYWISHSHRDSTRYFTLEGLYPILADIGFETSLVYRNEMEGVIVAKKTMR